MYLYIYFILLLTITEKLYYLPQNWYRRWYQKNFADRIIKFMCSVHQYTSTLNLILIIAGSHYGQKWSISYYQYHWLWIIVWMNNKNVNIINNQHKFKKNILKSCTL